MRLWCSSSWVADSAFWHSDDWGSHRNADKHLEIAVTEIHDQMIGQVATEMQINN